MTRMNSYLKQAIILFVFAGSISFLNAQTPIADAPRHAESAPQWPGCTAEMSDCTRSRLNQFIAANLTLPVEAKTHNAGGVVLVEFVIEKNGTIGEVVALHDPGYGLGAEAIRVIRLLNDKKIKWTPAEDKGKRTAYKYMIPVSYNLAKPAEEKVSAAVTEVVVPEVYEVAEVMPRFAGCEVNESDTIDCTFIQVVRHIKTNLTYPDTALAAGIQGPVVVEFVIDPSGKITNPLVRNGLGYGCDEEALRVISLMPAWQPGLQSGQPVPVRMVVPIMFQLPKPDKE